MSIELKVGDTVRHLKTGKVYHITGTVILEKNLREAFAYRRINDNVYSIHYLDEITYVRDAEEMQDGRFDLATATLIELFELKTLKKSLELELKGLRHSKNKSLLILIGNKFNWRVRRKATALEFITNFIANEEDKRERSTR